MPTLKEQDAGFQFPCAYQVKAMGYDDGEFKNTVIAIIEQHGNTVAPHQVSCKPSHSGKYLSVSITIQAQSREHLDAIYAALTLHDKVLMRL